MNEQERKNPSIASLSPHLAWNLLTREQQRQFLAYLEKACIWEPTKEMCKKQKEIHVKAS